jgi:hypothetical protein
LYSEVCPIEQTAAASWIVKASFSIGRSGDSRVSTLVSFISLAIMDRRLLPPFPLVTNLSSLC